jgi:hypothetical protein
MRNDIGALLHGEEIPAGARMALLSAALAATALALLVGWGLKTRAIAGGRL